MLNFRCWHALSFFVAMTASAQDIKPQDKWFRCEADSDCVHIEYSCAGGVVNRKHARRANDYYALENARSECITPPRGQAGDQTPYKVFCEAQRCKVEGRNPKPAGFS